MTEQDDTLTLARIAQIIRRYWVLIAVFTIVGAAGAYLISKSETPVYEADSSVYFSLSQGATSSDLNQGAAYTQAQMLSFAELATSHITLQRVIDDLGLNTTSLKLARNITVTSPQNTVILDITVSSPSATTAARIANSVASNLAKVVVELAPADSKSDPTVSARVIDPAVRPAVQSSPDKSRDAAIGGLLGLLIAIVGCILFTRLDTRVQSVEAVATVTDTPVLGQVGRLQPSADSRPVMVRDPNSEEAEFFRRARAGMRFASIDKDVHIILITSGVPGEGKTTFSVNIALAMAETNAKVLLVDADFRRPRVAAALGLEGAVGLTTVLIDGVTLAEARRPYGTTSLDLLLAGDVPPNPSELLSSARMAQVLAELSTEYDVIIVDSAPVISVADATFLAPHVDLTILMVDASKSRKPQLAKSIRSLELAGAHISGIVLNRLKLSKRRDDYYYGETLVRESRMSKMTKSRRATSRSAKQRNTPVNTESSPTAEAKVEQAPAALATKSSPPRRAVAENTKAPVVVVEQTPPDLAAASSPPRPAVATKSPTPRPRTGTGTAKQRNSARK